ncbi:hypothetical protein [Herbaspirillum huttiense]|uniref:hypothetical protein n=1 Tax=Herbaspirillum huttiense TaxID=863372 RepID=UPI0039B0D23A
MVITPAPKHVPPIAMLRWSVNAAKLVYKGFLPMFLLAFVGLTLGRLMAFTMPVAEWTLAVTYLVGIGFAGVVDARTDLPLGGFYKCLVYQLPKAMRVAAFWFGVMGTMLFAATLFTHTPMSLFFDPRMLVLFDGSIDGLFDFGITLSFFASARLLFLGSPFQYHLQLFSDMTFRHGLLFGGAGRPKKNLASVILLDVCSIVLLAVTSGYAPAAAPLVVPFVSALSYVAFREIYLGLPDNQTEPNAAHSAANPAYQR